MRTLRALTKLAETGAGNVKIQQGAAGGRHALARWAVARALPAHRTGPRTGPRG